MTEWLRLDKYLADMGLGTRSEIRERIRKGRVRINQEVCKRPETKVLIGRDEVYMEDARVEYRKFFYLMLHKPAGVVSATTDLVNRTVLDLIKEKQGKELFPVGRLDKDTEGLLLLTNDGDLAHRLLSPRKHVDKVYYARVAGKVTEEDKEAFLQGVLIEEDYTTLPARLNILRSGEVSEIELTITEGKFHQVKRMFEAVGKEVIYLKRLSMGGLILDTELAPGDYRELTDGELKYLNSLRGELQGNTDYDEEG